MRTYLLSAAAGALTVLLYPQFNLVWLAPFCLVPLLAALAREISPKHRFLAAWAAGFLYWAGVCYWIGFVLRNYGGLNAPLAVLAMILFSAAKGLHWAVFGWCAGRLIHSRFAILTIPALWAGLERTHGPLGFAWLTLGNAAADMEAPMRLAPLTGVYGISFVFVMMNAAVTLLMLRRRRTHVAAVILVPGVFLLPPMPGPETGREVAVAVQPNIEEHTQWTQEQLEQTIRHLALLGFDAAIRAQPPPELILWPEVPAPFYWETDPYLREQAAQMARLTGAHFLLGAVGRSPTGRPLNSALLISSQGEFVARYDKIQLVPFGEFVPPLFGWIQKISSESGDFAPGERLAALPLKRGSVGVFICYESAFPHLVRQFAAQGAELFVNLSNDGYFGRSAARQQHLLLARMRAAENRRWLIRATNDGITVVIDPAGRIAEQLPPFQRMASRVRFGKVSRQTPYSRYGDWFAWGCLGIGLGATLLASSHQFLRPIS